MSDRELPEWLRQARTRSRARHRPQARDDDWPCLPRAGDLRIANPIVHGRAEPRMVFVVDVEPEIGVARVALVSNETELASNGDVVIGAEASGLPFDLLLEAETVARVWCMQLGGLVAKLETGLARTVRRGAKDRKKMTGGRGCGVEDTPPPDQRSLFSAREREELGELSADCQQALDRHGTGTGVVLDPALFDPRLVVSEQQEFERFLSAAEIVVRSARATVPVAALESRVEAYGFGLRPRSGLRGPDAVRALLPLFERVLAEPLDRVEGDLELIPARCRTEEEAERELMSMLSLASRQGSRSVRLLTVPDAWTGEFPETMVMARVLGDDRTELQVIRHDLEAGS